jgi:DNA-binding transcriptional LysR family regulator
MDSGREGDAMDRLHAMQVFIRVADTGSFAKAARELNMSPPAVTRAIASLEDRLRARLFVRTTRSVKLTEPGQRFLDDCKRILADIDEAEGAANGSFGAPTGTLTVSAPVLFGQIYVLPIMTEFLDAHPGVTGRALFLDRVTHLIDEGIDVAIRIGHLPDAGHIATLVGHVRRVVCGAPAYFEQQGVPLAPADLANHRIIAPTSAWSSLDWHFGGDEQPVAHVRPALFCNTNEAAINAAVSGWGLTRLLSYQIAPQRLAGTLQTVLVDYEEPPLPVHVVHPEGRRPSAKVRNFVNFAVERLRANPLFN